jgi:hypothetical protein
MSALAASVSSRVTLAAAAPGLFFLQASGNPIRVQEAKDMCVLFDSLQVLVCCADALPSNLAADMCLLVTLPAPACPWLSRHWVSCMQRRQCCLAPSQYVAFYYTAAQLAHKCILNSFYGYVMRKGARWYRCASRA